MTLPAGKTLRTIVFIPKKKYVGDFSLQLKERDKDQRITFAVNLLKHQEKTIVETDGGIEKVETVVIPNPAPAPTPAPAPLLAPKPKVTAVPKPAPAPVVVPKPKVTAAPKPVPAPTPTPAAAAKPVEQPKQQVEV